MAGRVLNPRGVQRYAPADKKKILAVGTCDLLIASFVDGRGEQKTQLVLSVDGGADFWSFPAGTEEKMGRISDWFADQLRERTPGAAIAKVAREEQSDYGGTIENVELAAPPQKEEEPTIPEDTVSVM
jgi:hypothetical protein